jgi:hypothetical protein
MKDACIMIHQPIFDIKCFLVIPPPFEPEFSLAVSERGSMIKEADLMAI